MRYEMVIGALKSKTVYNTIVFVCVLSSLILVGIVTSIIDESRDINNPSVNCSDKTSLLTLKLCQNRTDSEVCAHCVWQFINTVFKTTSKDKNLLCSP